MGSGPRTTATSSPQVREAPSLLQHSSFRIPSSHTVSHSVTQCTHSTACTRQSPSPPHLCAPCRRDHRAHAERRLPWRLPLGRAAGAALRDLARLLRSDAVTITLPLTLALTLQPPPLGLTPTLTLTLTLTRGTMVEEDDWLRGAWPIVPPVRWTTCEP